MTIRANRYSVALGAMLVAALPRLSAAQTLMVSGSDDRRVSIDCGALGHDNQEITNSYSAFPSSPSPGDLEIMGPYCEPRAWEADAIVNRFSLGPDGGEVQLGAAAFAFGVAGSTSAHVSWSYTFRPEHESIFVGIDQFLNLGHGHYTLVFGDAVVSSSAGGAQNFTQTMHTGQLYTVEGIVDDMVTDNGFQDSSTGAGYLYMRWTVETITPEPATIAMVVPGLVALGVFTRRRRRTSMA